MASDEIGKGGDTISREQAMAAVRSEEECDGPIPPELSGIDRTELVRAAVRATKHNIEAAIRTLPSIAPDAVEADEAVTAAAWKNILFLIDGPSPRWTHGYNVWQATLLREIRTFARAARDGAR